MERRVKHLLAAVGAAASAATASAAAESADYKNLVAAGVYVVDFNADSGQLTGPLTPPGVEARATGATTAAFTYTRYLAVPFLGGGWAVSAALGVPPRYTLEGAGTIAGAGPVATARGWAPTLLLQKHFRLAPRLSIYGGAGVAYAFFTGERSTAFLDGALSGPTDVDLEGKWSPAFDAGVDVDLTQRLVGTFSFGYARLRPGASLTTDTPGVGPVSRAIDLKLDPFVYRISVGYRF